MRRATWYWRIWWWFGYHGLYQINWWWKRRTKGCEFCGGPGCRWCNAPRGAS